jgi:hypothetical protein
VEYRIRIDEAGRYELKVRYSNGLGHDSTHRVEVDGQPTGTVTYASQGWDQWREAILEVELAAGIHTVRFAKGVSFVELDALELRQFM